MKSIVSGDSESQDTLLLLHGTHTPYDSVWMEQILRVFDGESYRIIRPEFPEIYKSNSEHNDQTSRLVEYVKEFIENNGLAENLVIAGKSLGAKVAVEYALTNPVNELILLGYPMTFNNGEIREERTEKLNTLDTSVQIIQGEFDRYGTKAIISDLDFGEHVKIDWINEADHSYLLKDESCISKEHLEMIKELVQA